MKEEILEKHYEKRLEQILKTHSKMVLEDNSLSPIWKLNHLNKVGKMIKAGREHIYTIQEMDKIEKEDIRGI